METRDDVTTPRQRNFWICLSLLFLSFSWISSANAGYGWWVFSGAGVKFWESGTGGAYLALGINLFEYNINQKGFMGHPGHPGLPLTLMIAAVSRFYYWTSGAPTHYPLFVAKNLQSIILFSRLAITVVHLLSFYVLYRFAVDLLKSHRASMIAVLGYATSMVVLLYVNNLSPEPFLLIFALLALIWTRPIPELLGNGLNREAYLRAALAGFASVMAFYTKFMLAAPLLVFIPIFILAARLRPEQRLWENRNSRIAAMSMFIGGALLVFLLGTALVNWSHVLKYWMAWAPGKPQPVTGGTLANAWNLLVVTIPALITYFTRPTSWIPGLGPQTIFNSVEIGFAVLSVIGFVLYWRSHKSERNYLRWLIGFLLLYFPVLSYRAGGHYKIIHLAIGAVFFGYVIDRLARGLRESYPIFSNSFAVAVCFVLIIHGAGISIAILAKRGDVVKARQWQPYYTALSEISYDGHIGVIGKADLNQVSGMMTGFAQGSPAANAFKQFFVNMDPDTSSEELAAQKIQIVLQVDEDGNVRRLNQPDR